MPDLRIVDEDVVLAMKAELARRQRPAGERATGALKRGRHLLSRLIRCGSCGANHTLAGKDYYRCSRNRERGTCANATTVRIGAVEDAVLAALQTELLTTDLVRLFTEEFAREVGRLSRSRDQVEVEARARLEVLDGEIENLAKHFLATSVSRTIARMLSERAAEKEVLVSRLDAKPQVAAKVIPHPALVAKFEAKVARLREALNDDVVKEDAMSTLRRLVASVTVLDDGTGVTVLDVDASTATLIEFATNENTPRLFGGGVREWWLRGQDLNL